jgi:hypothetical protein
MRRSILTLAALALLAHGASAEVCNLKVVTDASPDYSDMASMVHSMTAKWPTPAQKCWAVFYWNHIARRQTAPMVLHGLALTDPVRQFNDYGYTMCSTISGINQGIWEHMGLKHKYWDITLHTVPEVFYDGRWHMYDNSMSAIYTLCDGKTIAGVEDIGKDGACAASGGAAEPGHVARYHCLNATSPRGFLTGADCPRSLDEEFRCFSPKGLKLRTYYYDWDYGHRYILNLRPGEQYARNYAAQGDGPDYYVPNKGKDPEEPNRRYRIRGHGQWVFKPSLAAGDWQKAAHSASGLIPAPGGGLQAQNPNAPGRIIYKVQGANVIASQTVSLRLRNQGDKSVLRVAVSTNNGLSWKDLPAPKFAPGTGGTGDATATWKLRDEVSGAYEVLVRIELGHSAGAPALAVSDVEIRTITQINGKTQPRLNLGRNTVYVGAGEQTDSIVFWPELQGGRYKEHIVEENNIACAEKHGEYLGVVHPAKAKEDAHLVYRLDAPRDLTKLTFGGRFYNRAPGSHIDLLYSLDAGRTWTKVWSLTDTNQPWDVIHYETVAIPPGHRQVWAKYLMNTSDASPSGCSLFAVRMEANHLPADPAFKPLVVTFRWSEPDKDGKLTERSHRQKVEKLPMRYAINVGGEDQPVMQSLTISAADVAGAEPLGYSDGKDVEGRKFVGQWLTIGKNLAVGKPYTCSAPSQTNWGAGDPDGKKLTDGVAGSPYAGGTSYRYGAVWNNNTNPVITLDLGAVATFAAVGLNFHGWPWWDALKGEVKDKVEVLISEDGQKYESAGFLDTDWRWKDLPANHMWPDEETITGATFRLIPAKALKARYVQYRITNPRIFCATELEVLDAITFEPFDLKIALPE